MWRPRTSPLACERRNLAFYGYGIRGFTLSMIETAVEVTGGRVPAAVIAQILAAGRDMLRHPVETLPGVRETLEGLAGDFHLVLITKGDLFAAVEIVSEKTADTYSRLFARHGHGPHRAMMVGNSLRSDVVPALRAGAWGVHVPHALTWELERFDEPAGEPRCRRIGSLAELAGLLAAL